MGCQNCGADAPPSMEMTPHGPVVKCDACGFMPQTVDQPVARDVAAEPERKLATKKPEPKREKIDPRALVKQAKRELKERRKRIRQLKRELAAEEKAEAELARLLDAADGKPLAVVRELRSSG